MNTETLLASPATTFSRRGLGAALAGAAIAATTPFSGAAAMIPAARTGALRFKRLIVLEMQGGNDGLNTLVPVKDPLYRHYRPNLAVPAADVIPLDDDVGLNAAMPRLAALYERGEVGWIQDVGYPHPNLSHFESAAIWASGRFQDIRGSGWAARAIAANRNAVDRLALDADGIILGGNTDILAGQGLHVLAIDDVQTFLRDRMAAPPPIEKGNSALRRITEIIGDSASIAARLRSKMTGTNRFQSGLMGPEKYLDPFNRQISNLLFMLDSDVRSAVYQVMLPGFDMHTGLRGDHENLLGRLDAGLASLVSGLKAMGLWQDTLILAHSEFGRRPAENGSGGTDHGTAGPVILLGGGVKGGLFGRRAALDVLDPDSNLVAT
ncbi:MAG TPA: DUF1501 domain-containing protein, partial [Sphingobium sp.]